MKIFRRVGVLVAMAALLVGIVPAAAHAAPLSSTCSINGKLRFLDWSCSTEAVRPINDPNVGSYVTIGVTSVPSCDIKYFVFRLYIGSNGLPQTQAVTAGITKSRGATVVVPSNTIVVTLRIERSSIWEDCSAWATIRGQS